MKDIKFKIFSFGCKVNHYDGAVLQNILLGEGFLLSADNPDFIIVNTCSVTKKAIRKDKQYINKISNSFPNSKIVVMGCWSQTAKEEVLNYLDNKKGIIIWGVGELELLVDEIKKEFKISDNNKVNKDSDLLASTDRSRYFLKISDGCDQFCSYCIIPHARGRLKSRALDDLVLESKKASERGYKEIVLTGIHLGRYGQDLDDKRINLVYLIKKILENSEISRIRLSSIEINEVTDDLIKLMSKESRLCRHLHISLQSGSDKILKLMNRPYTSSYFIKRANKIKKDILNIAISTDIIVGFPGESENDFILSEKISKLIEFSKIHVFPFSAHELTVAYKLDGKIKALEIKKRASSLRGLSDKLEEKYKKKILKEYKKGDLVLVKEKSLKKGIIRAKTEFGFDLDIKKEDRDEYKFL